MAEKKSEKDHQQHPDNQRHQQDLAQQRQKQNQESFNAQQLPSPAYLPQGQHLSQPQVPANILAQIQALQQQNSSVNQSRNSGASLSGISFLASSASQQMNTQHTSSTIEESFGSASQRQLLLALLSERLGPQPHSLDAFHRANQVDHSQALASVNRALQQQILINELLRSPVTASQSGGQSVSSRQLQDHMPLPAFQNNQCFPQNLLPPPNASLGDILSMDLSRVQPNTSLNLIGGGASSSLAPSDQTTLVGIVKGTDSTLSDTARKEGTEDFVKGKDLALSDCTKEKEETKSSQVQDKNPSRALPPRKRRKMVNFRLDQEDSASSSSSTAGPESPNDLGAQLKATFPLPALMESGVKSARLDAPPKLQLYKNLWGELDRATKSNRPRIEEFFRRRLHRRLFRTSKHALRS